MTDRLSQIKARRDTPLRHGWSTVNSGDESNIIFDVDWLIAEVERLRSELEFAQSSLPSAASVIHQDIS